ncbi:ATP-binding cassette domain-containing protein [Desulfovibrio sp. OttesenSCG-928-O18]|nr:ATP-binding cassette domain-containing protein [Desulfovibrio sp. OttesenSCG-928-O18]
MNAATATEGRALVFDGVSKSFVAQNGRSVLALNGVSLAVRPGGITALVGPDGAGKTTLLRIAAGLLAPDTGTYSLFGEADPAARPLHRIGYMPQKFGLYEDLSIQENLDLYADLRGLEKNAREKRYAELLAMTGLENFTSRLAGQLSGGMKQKLGLICTLVKAPDLLLLDEPTVGVDPLSRRELWEIVAALTARSRMAVLVSTAYLDEAAKCEEILMLFEGKTLAQGSPDELRGKAGGMAYMVTPANGETPRLLQNRLLGSPGVVDAVPQGGNVRLVHGELDAAAAEELQKRLGNATVAPTEAGLEDSFMLLLRREKTSENREAAPPASAPVASIHGNEGGPVIETRDVTRKFGNFIAVNNVSFSVNRGEVFGLLGPNGAGKTTTFRMLCGLLPATSGSLSVAGVDVRKARSDARRHIGYVAQKFSLYGPLTVQENLEFFAGAYGLKNSRKNERMDAVLRDFSLLEHEQTPAEQLPGGNKQRLAMAVGLLHEPDILFLDEPTSGADPLARREFWQRISNLALAGVTVIVTTHFMEEAEYCDRILIQDSGNMLALDTPGNIRKKAGANGTMEDAFIAIVEEGRKNSLRPGAGEARP